MAFEAPLPLVDRLLQLLQHLGLERAHVAAAVPGDWRGLARAHADRIASLSLRPSSGARTGQSRCRWPCQTSCVRGWQRLMGAGVTEGGCADASLYRRFKAAGLTDVRTLPQLAVYDDPGHLLMQYYQSRALGVLTPGEAQEWQAAMAQARAQGSFVLAVPHHCAVGTRP